MRHMWLEAWTTASEGDDVGPPPKGMPHYCLLNSIEGHLHVMYINTSLYDDASISNR